MIDEELIALYYQVRANCISEPRVVLYQYGNVAVCRDEAGEPVRNEDALEILTEQLETYKRLAEVKRILGFMTK